MSKKLQILIDQNIAFAHQAFSTLGQCQFADGREFSNIPLKNFDALIVRSVTQINRTLLENTNIKFVGTATIGTDHVDLNYLKEAGIAFAHAPGCNSQSVAEYVFSAVSNYVGFRNLKFENLIIGIIGKGNIGSKVEKMAKALGMNTSVNDPPLQRQNPDNDFVTLNQALDADIVTLHVPLTYEGQDKTYHLISKNELILLKNNSMFINSSRGSVTDNKALLETLSEKKIFTVLDVWENEPFINPQLLEKVDIATPHIAGYSLEGKVNGTKIIYDAFCKHFGFKPVWEPELPPVHNNIISLDETNTIEDAVFKIFRTVYDIHRDSNSLKKLSNLPEEILAKKFDILRKNYPLRREMKNYIVRLSAENSHLSEPLKNFGVKVQID